MQKRGRDLWVIWLVMAVLAASAWATLLHTPRKDSTLVPLTQVARLIKAGQVKRLVIDAPAVQVEKTDGEQLTARKEPNASLITSLRTLGVTPAQLKRVDLIIEIPPYGGRLHWLIVLSPLALVALWFSLTAHPTSMDPNRPDALLGNPAQRYTGPWARASPSTTWPVKMKPSKNWKRWSRSCVRRGGLAGWVLMCPTAYCWWGRQAAEKLCWRERWPAKPVCRFSVSVPRRS